MNELTNMRLLALLSEPSQTESNEEMECAYGNFVKNIEAISGSDDYENIHRTLNITRIELAALENIHRYEQGGKNALKKAYIQKVLALVEGLPTVQYLADKLNISAGYLSDMLRSLTGLNAQQHIHEKLIEKAKEYLTTGSLSVAEIAYQLGFEHPQSFSKIFKKKTSLSPSNYKQSLN